MEIAFWIVSALSLIANALAVVILVQLLRKVDPGWLRRWSGRLGLLIIGLALAWVGLTVWNILAVFGGVAGADPDQKATLLAAGISGAMNCLAALNMYLLLPIIIAVVVRVRTRTRRE